MMSSASWSPGRSGADWIRTPHVVVLTNVAAPYRLPAFRQLALHVRLTVIYCGERGRDDLPWRIDEEGEPFASIRLNSRSLRIGKSTLYLSPRIMLTLWRLKPTVIVSGGFSLSTVYASIYSAARRAPLLIFSDGTHNSERRNPRSRNSRLQDMVRWVVVRRSAGAIAASKPAAERFEELGYDPSRVHIALHSTEMERYWTVGAERREIEGPVRFLFVGRLIDGKGLDHLLEAFADVSQRYPGVTLRIVGRGPLGEQLRRKTVTERISGVIFVDFVDQESLPAIYEQAQVFVFPTLGDTFGMAMLEAAAAGLAIVSSPWAGANDHLVVEGVSGTIVDPTDREAMADALAQLARQPSLVAAWGRETHRLSRAHTVDGTVNGYVQAIRQAEDEGSHRWVRDRLDLYDED